MQKLVEGARKHWKTILVLVLLTAIAALYTYRTAIGASLSEAFPSKATQYYAKLEAEKLLADARPPFLTEEVVADIRPPPIDKEVVVLAVVSNEEYQDAIDQVEDELVSEGYDVTREIVEKQTREMHISDYVPDPALVEEMAVAKLNADRIDDQRREIGNLNAIIKGQQPEIDRRANHLACSKIISKLHRTMPYWTPEGFIDLVLWNDIVKYCGALRTKYP